MQQNEKVSSESSSPLQWLDSPPDLPKPTSSCLDTSKMTQDESLANLVLLISMSKSKKAKDMGIKKSIKANKQSSTVGDVTFTGSSDDSDQMSKKRKLTDDRIPDTQTMVQQLQKLDLSPSQIENAPKANRKGRNRLLLKSSYPEINMRSENDFIDSNKDSTNDTLLALKLLQEDVKSESQLHTAASLQETEGKLNPAALHESGDQWEI